MTFIAINTIILALLSWVLYIKSAGSTLRKYYWPLITVKYLAGIALGMLYTYYYTGGDTFTYLEKSGKLSELALTDVRAYLTYWVTSAPDIIDLGYDWSPNEFFVKIVSLFDLLTGHNYWLISLYFSLMSFSGLWYLAMSLNNVWGKNPFAIILALFCVPTVLFWSSGLTKESLVLALISVILAVFVKGLREIKKITPLTLLQVLVAFVILWHLRYYYAGILAVVLTGAITTECVRRTFKVEHTGLLIITFFISGVILVLFVSQLHPNFYFSRILQVIVENHDAIASKSRADGMIIFSDLKPNTFSFIKNFPLALFSGIFRPFFAENTRLMYWVPGIESLILLVFVLSTVFYRQNLSGKKWIVAIIAMVSYSFTMASFLAFSAPNFGALVRYRVGFMPFLFLLVMINNPWLKKRSRKMF